MAENTEISWCHHTFNPWSGCTKVSPACDICYAEVNYSVKMRGVKWGKYGNRIIASDSMWKQPLKWNRQAEVEGVRKRVFCASLADVFEGIETIPTGSWNEIAEARVRLFELIEVTPHLDWLLLTKRPENVLPWLEEFRDDSVGISAYKLPANVWIGTTAENQKYADIRIPELLKIPAAIRFISVEPMLGPIDLQQAHRTRERLPNWPDATRVDWVICGGESGGQKARPMHPDWVRSLRDQCVAAGVPFHFKQWGEWAELPVKGSAVASHSDFDIVWPDGTRGSGGAEENGGLGASMFRLGKKNTGRTLDGREWLQFPEGLR